jgi:hypothetical protein
VYCRELELSAVRAARFGVKENVTTVITTAGTYQYPHSTAQYHRYDYHCRYVPISTQYCTVSQVWLPLPVRTNIHTVLHSITGMITTAGTYQYPHSTAQYQRYDYQWVNLRNMKLHDWCYTRLVSFRNRRGRLFVCLFVMFDKIKCILMALIYSIHNLKPCGHCMYRQ